MKKKQPIVHDGVVYLPDGTEYLFTKANRDINGNRRYFVSWMALGLPKYESTPLTRRAGLKKVKTKAFGGGFMFQCASGDLIRAAEFFHGLGLRRANPDSATLIQAAESTIDKAIESALKSGVRVAYVIQSLAHALRAGSIQSSRVHGQIRTLDQLADKI
jgi:hypothetical protein